VKIAIVGAGSYVFGMGLLYDLIVEHRLPGMQLALMDLDGEMASLMAGVAGRMAADAGVAVELEATTDRTAALAGADYVTTSVAVQLRRRWEMDKAVMHRYGIREITSECGGVGGLSYALRSVALLLAIARDMERLCPQAWLFNVTNPLPRVVTALTRHTRIRTAGFCSNAWGAYGGYGNVAALVGRDMREIDVVSAGLNHFAWLLSARDRRTGEDLLPAVQAALEGGAWIGRPLTRGWWRRYGVLPLDGDSHTGEFFPFDPADGRELVAHHGNDEERTARREALRAAAAGRQPWQPLLQGRAWERPADVIEALTSGRPRYLDMINVPNRGAIEGLPEEAIVQVPAWVEDGEIRPVGIGPLPPSIAELCTQVSHVHDLVAEAAATGDRALVAEAVRADPAISDKAAGLAAIEELIRVHGDLLTQFS